VTDKLLLELADLFLIETVIIRAAPRRRRDRSFPENDLHFHPGGLRHGLQFLRERARRLEARLKRRQIVAQLLQSVTPRMRGGRRGARAELASFDNIVVMGMGEPLANYDALILALTS